MVLGELWWVEVKMKRSSTADPTLPSPSIHPSFPSPRMQWGLLLLLHEASWRDVSSGSREAVVEEEGKEEEQKSYFLFGWLVGSRRSLSTTRVDAAKRK